MRKKADGEVEMPRSYEFSGGLGPLGMGAIGSAIGGGHALLSGKSIPRGMAVGGGTGLGIGLGAGLGAGLGSVTGAAAGIPIGGAAGALGMMRVRGTPSEDNAHNMVAVPMGMLTGAGVGAGIGAGVGSIAGMGAGAVGGGIAGNKITDWAWRKLMEARNGKDPEAEEGREKVASIVRMTRVLLDRDPYQKQARLLANKAASALKGKDGKMVKTAAADGLKVARQILRLKEHSRQYRAKVAHYVSKMAFGEELPANSFQGAAIQNPTGPIGAHSPAGLPMSMMGSLGQAGPMGPPSPDWAKPQSPMSRATMNQMTARPEFASTVPLMSENASPEMQMGMQAPGHAQPDLGTSNPGPENAPDPSAGGGGADWLGDNLGSGYRGWRDLVGGSDWAGLGIPLGIAGAGALGAYAMSPQEEEEEKQQHGLFG
jgi:hypothetical protein